MSVRTLNDRLELLDMPDVVRSISKGEIDPYVALRAGQTAKSLPRHRPELTEKLGGEAAVRTQFIQKVSVFHGMTSENYRKLDSSSSTARGSRRYR